MAAWSLGGRADLECRKSARNRVGRRRRAFSFSCRSACSSETPKKILTRSRVETRTIEEKNHLLSFFSYFLSFSFFSSNSHGQDQEPFPLALALEKEPPELFWQGEW